MDIFRLRLERPAEELLRCDHYSPEELAGLLDVSPALIRHEIWHGDLRAYGVHHHAMDIRRDDALDWLRHRQAR
jgi:hypothetical protein